MRLLYTNDWHLQENTPVNRVDDFKQVMFNKLDEINEIRIKEKIDFVIHGGDLFDSWKVSPEFTGKVIRHIFDYVIYGIPGNHDLLGYNLTSYDKSSLSVLEKSGHYIRLDRIQYLIKGDEKVRIIGIPAGQESILEDLIKEVSNRDTREPRIVVNHAMITDEENLPYEHTYYKVLDGIADVVLCSHWHKPFYMQTDKSIFINNGSLMRCSIDERHEPQVCIIDTKDL